VILRESDCGPWQPAPAPPSERGPNFVDVPPRFVLAAPSVPPPMRSVRDRIRDALPGTFNEIAARTGVLRPTVVDNLRRMRGVQREKTGRTWLWSARGST
jgi:hypothetical protein